LDQVQNVLQQLEYNNLLLLLIHKDQGWYRYHALLQTVLQRRMRSLFTPAEVDVYYCRAAAWFACCGDIEQALRLYLAAG
jgi:ATP/maltotriose-dependent transcriptional regulator MalT